MKNGLNISVIGGGHGGLAEAAYLSLSKFNNVILYNRTLTNIISENEKVEITGSLNDVAYISKTTDRLKTAIENAKVIFIILPAYAHREIIRKMKDYLIDGQIIVLMPGKLGGCLEAVNSVMDINKDVTIFETESVVVGARRLDKNQVYIHGIKHSVKLGGLNILKKISRVKESFELLKKIHPEFVLVDNVMEASFSEVGCILHPVINLLNASRIESGNNFLFYVEGVTPAVAKIINSLDSERISIADSYGISVESVSEITKRYYHSIGGEIISVLKTTDTYKDVAAPVSIDNRFFKEDVLISLGLYKDLAVLAGISVPVIDSIFTFVKNMCPDFKEIEPRNLADLGLEGYEYEKLKKNLSSYTL